MTNRFKLFLGVMIIIFFNFIYVIFLNIFRIRDHLKLSISDSYVFDTLILHIFLFILFLVLWKIISLNINFKTLFVINKKLVYLIPLSIIVAIIIKEVGIYISETFAKSLPDFGYAQKMLVISKVSTSYLTIITFTLTIGIIAPVTEELFVRGLAYNVLRERFNIVVSVSINSLIFFILHIIPSIFPFIIISNVFLCIAYERTKNILIPITMHITINISSIVYNLYQR